MSRGRVLRMRQELLISVVMVVRNEEQVLENKLRNLLESGLSGGALADCRGLRWIYRPDGSDSSRLRRSIHGCSW